MSVVTTGSVRRGIPLTLRAVAFFVLLYLYVWLRIEPVLLYFRVGPRFPSFRLGLPFLWESASYPGGMVEYVSALLSQFYYYPLVGALVVTLVGGLLCLGAWVFLRATSGVRPDVVHFVPAVLLLALYSQYAHHLTTSLALLTAVGGTCVYVAVQLRSRLSRLALFLGLSLPVYYLAAGAYVLYAGLCGLDEFRRKRWFPGVVCLACGLILPYGLGTCLFRTRPLDSYARLLPWHPEVKLIAWRLAVWLYAFFPLAALGVAVREWLKGHGRSGPVGRSEPARGKDMYPPPKRLRRFWVGSAVLLVAAVATALVSFDGDAKRVLQVEYYAQHRMWPQILKTARLLPRRRYDLVVYLTVNWALYHEGRLPYDLLAYPQHRGSLLRVAAEFLWSAPSEYRGPSYLACVRLSDIYFDLGRVNESEHMAHEALENGGRRPWILERIALVNIVKGRTAMGRTFLRALEDDVVYRKRARQWLRRLEADPSLASDEQVARVRRLRPEHSKKGEPSTEELLLALLDKNEQNRMAFEYLMAYYLLTGNLEGIVRNLSRLVDLGYSSVPRSYQEAAVLYAVISGRSVDAQAASEGMVQRFGRFERALARHGSDMVSARRALAKDYGDSYFLYYLCYLVPGPEE